MKDTPSTSIEITVLTKQGGPLTKRISLAQDGTVKADGSACIMTQGDAHRLHIAGVAELATTISQLDSTQAIALGALRAGLPDQVKVVTKSKLNGAVNVIARTSDHIKYQNGRPAFVLLDFDTKGMPPDVAARLKNLGGFWAALVTVLPELSDVAHIIRRSTSAGLMRLDTGEEITGSSGLHGYVVIVNGADAERFLATLHARCWLHGLGWYMVGVAGQLLERGIVDRMVGAPERLVFEGPPILEPPLVHDAESRRAKVHAGEILDTLTVCPPLTAVERYMLGKLRAEASQRLLPERTKAREAFIDRQARRLVERTGMAKDQAARVIEQQCRGVLLADVLLPFDDDELAGATVANVLDDPARFEGCTMADPIEGIEYGRCKAKIMRGADGRPWINSFAHGLSIYRLRYDARAVRVRIERAEDQIDTFVKLALSAQLDDIEIKQLTDEVARRTGVGVRAIAATLKSAKQEQQGRRSQERRERHLAERSDPRPQLQNPSVDAPWLPEMNVINDVMAIAMRVRRPRRDIDNDIARKRRHLIPNTHAFTSHQEEDDQ
jgi:hypothetical protein